MALKFDTKDRIEHLDLVLVDLLTVGISLGDEGGASLLELAMLLEATLLLGSGGDVYLELAMISDVFVLYISGICLHGLKYRYFKLEKLLTARGWWLPCTENHKNLV